jgi:hypothetical protein
LPDLTQVNFLVAVELVSPALAQAAPAIGVAAWEFEGIRKVAASTTATIEVIFLMPDINWAPKADVGKAG